MYKLHIQIEGPLREVQRAFKIKKEKKKEKKVHGEDGFFL